MDQATGIWQEWNANKSGNQWTNMGMRAGWHGFWCCVASQFEYPKLHWSTKNHTIWFSGFLERNQELCCPIPYKHAQQRNYQKLLHHMIHMVCLVCLIYPSNSKAPNWMSPYPAWRFMWLSWLWCLFNVCLHLVGWNSVLILSVILAWQHQPDFTCWLCRHKNGFLSANLTWRLGTQPVNGTN